MAQCFSQDKCDQCHSSAQITYTTSFQDHIINNCHKGIEFDSNGFTTKAPSCIHCVPKNIDKAKIMDNVLQINFPVSVGSSETFWTRLETTDCSGFSFSGTRGYLDAWIYFPPSDGRYANNCNSSDTKFERIPPFYHGGKLFGLCSSQCPTGNTQDAKYDTDWTLRLMFREQGRLALLYSVPLGGFLLEPVPPQLRSVCCPRGDCSSFVSDSTDQYWFATRDTSLHPYRLAEYTWNPVSSVNCCTQKKWPDGSSNPIESILEAGKWNFLRLEWNIQKKSVQVFHTTDSSTDPNHSPSYTPSGMDMVINTPEGMIPFQSGQHPKSFYFQPFFGGSGPDWIPTSVNASCTIVPGNPTPTFSFGDILVYSVGQS